MLLLLQCFNYTFIYGSVYIWCVSICFENCFMPWHYADALKFVCVRFLRTYNFQAEVYAIRHSWNTVAKVEFVLDKQITLLLHYCYTIVTLLLHCLPHCYTVLTILSSIDLSLYDVLMWFFKNIGDSSQNSTIS